jgi:hypothetical protein
VDVVLSSDDDDDAARPPGHEDPTDRKVSVADDAEGTGITSAEALIPDLIRAGASGNTRPPFADRVPTIPPSGMRGRKRLCLAMKRSNPILHVEQVMSQV